MKHRLDPNSPIPLYHQIAEAVRWSIYTLSEIRFLARWTRSFQP